MSDRLTPNIVHGSLVCLFCHQRVSVAVRAVNLTGQQFIVCLECCSQFAEYHRSLGSKDDGNETETEETATEGNEDAGRSGSSRPDGNGSADGRQPADG